MAGYELEIVSWRGVSVNDGTNYEAYFIREDNVFDGSAAQPIEAQITGSPPSHVRSQPQGDNFVIEVEMMGAFTQSSLDTMKKYWSPFEQDEGWLVCTPEGGGGNRRISAVVERIEIVNPQIMHVFMRSATGIWEAASATEDTLTVTASGQTDSLTNAGNTKVYPTFTITPGTVMADTDSWIKRRRVHIANRSELPFTDPVGDGWPVDLTENAWDTDALNTASKVLSSLDDVRVILKGREINRWMDPTTDNATTKTWVNMQMRARKTATLAAAVDADDTTFTVNNPTLLQGWPQAGFFLINSERIQYTARTASTLTVVRGSGNTTAASHAAADTLYWTEHPFLDIIYHYDNAGDPAPPDDKKPRISLVDSTNTSFKWTSAFLNASDRRSAAWQPLWTDDGFTADYITLATVGGTLQFKDMLPTASRPNYNNVYLDCPVPALGSFTFDEIIQRNMLLHVYVIDFLGGKERLLEAYPSDANLAAATQTLSLDLATARIRLNGRIGALTGLRSTTADTFSQGVRSGLAVDTGLAISFVLEQTSRITGFLVRLGLDSGSPTLFAQVFMDSGDVPDRDADESDAFDSIGTISSTPSDVLLTPDHTLVLPAGKHHLVLSLTNGSDGDIDLYSVHDRVHPTMHTVDYGEDFENIAFDATPKATVYTDETPAQADAPVATEDFISLVNLTVPFDSDRTPKIVFAAEETCYLLNARLKNDTTGDYIDLFYPMALSENVVIDCAAKTVTDGETGVEIPFIATPSNPSEWIYLQPGANTISYTEVGVVSTVLAHSFRSRWL